MREMSDAWRPVYCINVIEEKVRLAAGKANELSGFLPERGRTGSKIMEKMVWNLSSAIVSLVNILNFQIVLLGMDSVYWPERYVRMLEEITMKENLSETKDTDIGKESCLSGTYTCAWRGMQCAE